MSHMAMEMLRLRTGIKVQHLPYKGAAPASVSLLSGETQVAFLVMPVAAVQIKAGKLRGLGVAAPQRSAAAPEMPTMEEAGVKDNIALQWNGFFAPARTPPAILDRLHREVAKAVHLPDVVQRFETEGATPSGSTPAEFASFFNSEAKKWADVARRSGTKLD
jgi:tripartite-type tricarboxylate transporter receptor subunit TctC